MAINKAMRRRVFDKCGGRCAYCGCVIELKTFQVDHIVCQQYGHSIDDVDAFENLNPACRPCNNFKNVWSLEAFRHELSQQIERARKYSVNFRNAERFGMLSVISTEVVFYFERLSSNAGSSHHD